MDGSSHGQECSSVPRHGETVSNSAHDYVSLPFPHIKSCRLLPFHARNPLRAVSCLQMTSRRVFFTWNRHFLPRSTADEAYLANWPPLGDSSSSSASERTVVIGFHEVNYGPIVADELDVNAAGLNFLAGDGELFEDDEGVDVGFEDEDDEAVDDNIGVGGQWAAAEEELSSE